MHGKISRTLDVCEDCALEPPGGGGDPWWQQSKFTLVFEAM